MIRNLISIIFKILCIGINIFLIITVWVLYLTWCILVYPYIFILNIITKFKLKFFTKHFCNKKED